MACIRFSLFLLLLITMNAFAQERFSSRSCLESSYKMKMEQQGPLFGLLKHEFIINKKNCIINISHKKYLPKEWIVDVCREPVHIKVTSATGVDVAKKDANCLKKDNSRDTGNFCSQYFDLSELIQDDGLIFAQGDRDDLNSDHGKTFCTYLLIKKYLNEGVVFSRYTEVPDIFIEKKIIPVQPSDEVDETEPEVKKDPKKASTETLKSITSNF